MDRAIFNGIYFIFFIAIIVFILEFFIPISKNAEFKAECRKALLQMELDGGLTTSQKNQLKNSLESKGFTVVSISAPVAGTAKQGEKIDLRVQVIYEYNKLSNLFKRNNVEQTMNFNRTSIARKVIN